MVVFSGAMSEQEKTLKALLYQRLYRNPTVMKVREGAEQVVRDLFARYLAEPAKCRKAGARY
jgi:dGTPase